MVFEIVVICLQVILLGIGTALIASIVYYHLSKRRSSDNITMDEYEPKQKLDVVSI